MSRFAKIFSVLLLAISMGLPVLALGKGPSPAKRAKSIYNKMGYFTDSAVTVGRNLQTGIGTARVKLINGQVLHSTVDLKTNRLLGYRDLRAVANKQVALAAGRQGWKKGYAIEGEPGGMMSSMTRRGNVRRFVIDYDRGLVSHALVTFSKTGALKSIRIDKPY